MAGSSCHDAGAAARVVPVSGRLDALNAPDLEARLAAVGRDQPATVVVDLGNVTYMSSSGLRVLMLAHRRQQEAGGQLLLCNVPRRVMRVLHLITGFDQVLAFCTALTPQSD